MSINIHAALHPNEIDNSTFHNRMLFLVNSFTGGNRAAFADFVGSNPPTMEKYYRPEGGRPNFDMLIQIAQRTNIHLDWLMLGEGPCSKSTTSLPVVSLKDAGECILNELPTPIQNPYTKTVFSSIGVIQSHLVSHQAMDPSDAIIAVAEGELMADKIQSGDLLLINRNQRQITSGAYFYCQPGATYLDPDVNQAAQELLFEVCNLRRLPDGSVVLQPENSNYSPTHMSRQQFNDANIIILGKVEKVLKSLQIA